MKQGFKIIDPGHRYELKHIDGFGSHYLTFVKRCGENFPGNVGAYEGTTLQIVIRVLINRVYYLDSQKTCLENKLIIKFLKYCLWLLEFRAARRHKIRYTRSSDFAASSNLCEACGHTICNCLEQVVK